MEVTFEGMPRVLGDIIISTDRAKSRQRNIIIPLSEN